MLNDWKPTSDDQPPGTESCAVVVDAEKHSNPSEITTVRSLVMRSPLRTGQVPHAHLDSDYAACEAEKKAASDSGEDFVRLRDRLGRPVQPLDTICPFV